MTNEHTTTAGAGTADAAGPAQARALSRQRLGTELRQFRLARSLHLEDVAARLEVAPSTLSRIETGRAPVKTGYLAIMLDLYRIDDPAQRERLADLASEGQHKAWWAGYATLLPAGTGHYLDLETAASHIRCYADQAIPGLVQTRAYAEAAIRAARPGLTGSHVLRLVALQRYRQQHIRAGGHRLHLIIDQAALLRPVGTLAVMASQLDHLHAVTADPAITIQIAELGQPCPVLTPPFTILTLNRQPDPYICHDGIGGQVFITRRRADLQATHDMFAALAGSAASPEDSVTLIMKTAERWQKQAHPATSPRPAGNHPARASRPGHRLPAAAGRSSPISPGKPFCPDRSDRNGRAEPFD